MVGGGGGGGASAGASGVAAVLAAGAAGSCASMLGGVGGQDGCSCANETAAAYDNTDDEEATCWAAGGGIGGSWPTSRVTICFEAARAADDDAAGFSRDDAVCCSACLLG